MMIKRIKGSITNKLLFISISLSIVPLILISFNISNHFFKSYFEKSISNSNSLLAITSNNIDEKIRRLSMISLLAITDSSIRELMDIDEKYKDEEHLREIGFTSSERLVTARKFFYKLEILNPDICGSTLITNREVYGYYPGGQIYDPVFSTEYKNYEWYKKSLELHGEMLLISRHCPYQIKGAGIQTVSAVRSIFDAISNKYLGTILIDLNISHLDNVLKNAISNNGGLLMLIDSDNRVVASGGGYTYLENQILDFDFSSKSSGYFHFKGEDGTKYFFNYIESPYTKWKLGHLMPESVVRRESWNATALIVKRMSIIIILMTLGIKFTISSVSVPIMKINQRIEKIGTGDLSDYINEFEKRDDEIGQLSRSIIVMKNNLTELIQKLTKAISGQKEAQLKALQSQINPHFILNTINSIQMMSRLGKTGDVVFMLENLGRLFKNYIRTDKTMVTIREEEESIKTYINIQRMRYGDKLCYISRLQENILDFYCLKFIVQPIIENSIFYGMEMKNEKTTIIFGGEYLDDKRILLYVEDDGAGMTEEILDSLKSKLENPNEKAIDAKSSIGLQNVQNRLRLYYGNNYGITVESALGKGTRINIVIPVIGKQR
jgi:two-component system sensor histidine kinase YesM